MRKKQAFTLIELLVVIAILAILIAILLPVSFKALEMSKRSRCASNLRSLGAAFTSYATDHNGEMPHNKALPPPTGSFTEVTQFRIIITNGLKRREVKSRGPLPELEQMAGPASHPLWLRA